MSSLAGKTIVMSGGSRGIGKAIAIRAARDGANIAIFAKTDQPHPKLEGTIHSAARDIEAAGGRALPLCVDIRNDEAVQDAVNQTIQAFGGIDIVINNASAVQLTRTLETDMKRYDLMMDVNTRGTFLLSKTCIPHLLNSLNPHILNLSPPINMKPKWFANHLPYTISKYGMSMCVIGMAEEFRKRGIAVNALWPRTTVATAAIQMLGGEPLMQASRSADIMADAAYAIITRPSKECTGNFFIDEEVLRSVGIDNFDKYKMSPNAELMEDFYIS